MSYMYVLDGLSNDLYMGVSWNKYPQIIHLNGIFPYKLSSIIQLLGIVAALITGIAPEQQQQYCIDGEKEAAQEVAWANMAMR